MVTVPAVTTRSACLGLDLGTRPYRSKSNREPIREANSMKQQLVPYRSGHKIDKIAKRRLKPLTRFYLSITDVKAAKQYHFLQSVKIIGGHFIIDLFKPFRFLLGTIFNIEVIDILIDDSRNCLKFIIRQIRDVIWAYRRHSGNGPLGVW